jgi:DNA-binding Lrp family transcriptional regulator
MTTVTALVSLFVEASRMGEVLKALSKLDNIEEFSVVTGEYDIQSVVSCEDMEEFRHVLKNRIQKIPGVRSTVTSIVLETHKGPRSIGEPYRPITGPSTFA